jgi:phosphatidylglycerol---prolipoprotein diacylglyceryl transferase
VPILIDPILIEYGPLRVSWYGLMYVFGFLISYFLVLCQIRKKESGLTRTEIESLFFYLIVGLALGARFGYALFYSPGMYLRDPLEIFAVWRGGMSFHGGLIGVVAAGILFSRKNRKSFWKIADLLTVTAPVGLALGRIGNFINGELYGRVTEVPWGMVFPGGGPLPRHPSQLYQSALEGFLLFAILWRIKDNKKIPEGGLLPLFLILYGIFRFFVEFFREPDAHLGFILGPFSMGQVLCSLMVLAGIVLYARLRGRKGRD